MKHKALFWVCVFALRAVGVMAPSHRAEGAWILHDDFNDPSLLVRHDLWNMRLGFSGGPGTTEVVRLIDGVLLEALGLAAPDDPRLLIARRLGAREGAPAGFDFVQYRPISQNTNGIRADVTMKGCIVEDGQVQARVRGFFGEGSPTTEPFDFTTMSLSPSGSSA